MSKKHEIIADALKDIPFMVIGCALYAVSVTCFSAPNNIVLGGVTGVATVINYLVPALPIGALFLLLNIPILIFGARKLGGSFLAKTIFCTVLSSVMIDLSALFLPAVRPGDQLLAALYAGVLSGLGMALIFLRGGTTGGVDVMARLINRKYPYFSIGRAFLAMDAAVVLAAAFVYGEVNAALYSVVTIFASSKMIDAVLYSSEKGETLMIVSKKGDEISHEIGDHIRRGATFLHAEGAYSHEKRKVLLCAARPQEVFRINHIVKNTDPNAFIIISEASQVIGEGFKAIEEKK